jgi:hypothetical protein
MNFSNPMRSNASAQLNVLPPPLVEPITTGDLQGAKAELIAALSKTEVNPFRKFWDLGFRRLLPVTPHDCGVRSAGKRPGLKGAEGWYGQSAKAFKATEELLEVWHAMNAGVGIRCDSDSIGFDIDTLSPEWAQRIGAIAEEMLGKTYPRIGMAPKILLPYRSAGEIGYRAIRFDDGLDPQKPGLIELQAGETKWYVGEGIHPGTSKPYSWPQGVPHINDLPVVTAEKLDAFYDRLADELPRFKSSISTHINRNDVDQKSLKGDPERVRSAMAAIPNRHEDIGYDEWVKIAAALRGACQDDFDLGLELFVEFSERSDIGDPTEDPERIYRTMLAPFGLGAEFLYDKAHKLGRWQQRITDLWWQPIADYEPLFPEESNDNVAGAAAPKPRLIRASPYRFPDPAKIPRREWLYGQHYIREFLSVTVAPGGLGKSSLIIAEALAMASGKPLLGVQPQGQFRVWLLNGEDPLVELERRVAAVMLHYGLTPEDVGDRLFLDSGRDTELIIAKQEREGTVIAAPVVGAVVNEIRANRIDVFQVDPFVSSHRVKENDNDAIDMVAKQWGTIAGLTKCSIELVHHVRKTNGAEVMPEDGRGAGALVAAARSARTLNRMTKDEAAKLGLEDRYKRLLRFGDAKANLTPPPASDKTEWMQLVSQPLGNGEGGAVEAEITGDNIGVVARFEMPSASAFYDDEKTDKALAVIRDGEWRGDVRAGETWAGVPIAVAFGLDAEADRAKIKSIIAQWLSEGRLKEVWRKDSNRKKRRFIEVASQGIFE